MTLDKDTDELTDILYCHNEMGRGKLYDLLLAFKTKARASEADAWKAGQRKFPKHTHNGKEYNTFLNCKECHRFRDEKARASACKCAMCDDDAMYCSDCTHNIEVSAEENARAEGMSDEALYVAYCWLNDGFKVPKEDFTEERKEWVRKAFAEAKATDRRARSGEKEV